MGARNREGIGLSYRLARLHRLAESIHGLIKSLKIPPQFLPQISEGVDRDLVQFVIREAEALQGVLQTSEQSRSFYILYCN
jgi:hypothetical protein